MKVAFLYNLNRRRSPHELEFELPSTVEELSGALTGAHTVKRIECTPDIPVWVKRLTDFGPDVCFSVAEGFHSAVREAFYPALYEQLGYCYTGSDPIAHMFSQNKALAKILAQSVGVRTPAWRTASSPEELNGVEAEVKFPCIVKPNSEGSSIGIDEGAIVHDKIQLQHRAEYVWNELRNVALIEEFIDGGTDLSISYVENLEEEIFGPVSYDIADNIYHHDLKARSYLYPDMVVSSSVSPQVQKTIRSSMRALISAFDLRGYGRADFRMSADGILYFLEMNAQVEMSEKGEFAVAVELAGIGFQRMVLHIAQTAYENRGRLPSSTGVVRSGISPQILEDVVI